jgi:hypothetical protein
LAPGLWESRKKDGDILQYCENYFPIPIWEEQTGGHWGFLKRCRDYFFAFKFTYANQMLSPTCILFRA